MMDGIDGGGLRSVVCLFLPESGGVTQVMGEVEMMGKKYRVVGMREEGVVNIDFNDVYRMCSDVCSMIEATRSADLVLNRIKLLEEGAKRVEQEREIILGMRKGK